MEGSKKIRSARPTIKASDIDFSPILIGILVILFTLAIYYLWKKRSQKRTHVLLTGLCEAGKTATFSQLLFNELRETFTSISENSGYYSIDGTSKIVQVVDIPGHERLRNRFVDQYKRIAKGIVYVVDSANIQKEIRDVADFLYTLLADPATSSVPFLIACNKQDETFAKGSAVIKTLLEKEMNLVRNSRQSQLKSVDNSSSDQVFLGKAGKDLEFGHLTQTVDVAEYSAQESDLDSIHTWIKRL